MVLDCCEKLKEYYPLDDNLRGLSSLESKEIPQFNGFLVNRKSSCLYTVNKGSAIFATSWRENPDSMETTAALTAQAGHFVLYLPGEPMLVKCGEGSEVSLFEL